MLKLITTRDEFDEDNFKLLRNKEYKSLIKNLYTYCLPIETYCHSKEWKNLFSIKGLSSDLSFRLLYVLHYIVVPNINTIEIIENELDKLKSIKYIPQLWTYVQKKEEIIKKFLESYHKKDSNDLREVYQSLSNHIWSFIDSDNYENILHKSVDDDYIQSTYFICNIEEICSNNENINQPNVYGETPLHRAARQLKMNHLKILINTIGINLNFKNKSNQNFLHMLFISLQTRWNKRENYSNIIPSRMQVLEILNLLSSIQSNFDVFDLLYGKDNFDCDVLIYSIITKSYVLVQALLKLFPIDDIDFTIYLKKAILTNQAELVTIIANFYISNTNLTEDIESIGYLEKFSDLVRYALEVEKLKSLQALCNISIFQSSINYTNANKMPLLTLALEKIITSSQSPSLNININQVFHSQVVRLLLRNGAIIMQRLNLPSNIDNYFSYVSRMGSEDLLRQLLLAIHSSTYCFSRYDSIKMQNTFFLNEFSFYSNPIVEAVQSGNSNFLEYIIEHTIFKAFLNEQDISGHNPITMACLKGNIEAIQILLRKGANILHSLNTSKEHYEFNQKNVRHLTNKHIEIEKQYRVLVIDANKLLNEEKLNSLQSNDMKQIDDIIQESKNLSEELSSIQKEEFFSLPAASKKDPSIKKFLDCLLSILRMRMKKLTASEIVKTFLRHNEVKRIFCDIIVTLTQSVSTSMTSSMYILPDKAYIDTARTACNVVDQNRFKWQKQKDCQKLLHLFGKWFRLILKTAEVSEHLQAKKVSDDYKSDYSFIYNMKKYTSFRKEHIKNCKELLFDTRPTYPLHHLANLTVDSSSFYDDKLTKTISKYVLDSYWWIKASNQSNWKFLQVLTDNIMEFDENYEDLIVSVVKSGEQDLLMEFSKKASFLLGKTIDHLCASVDDRNGILFLELMIGGVYSYDDVNFWNQLKSIHLQNRKSFKFHTIGSRIISMFQLARRLTSTNDQLSLNENNSIIQSVLNDVGQNMSSLSQLVEGKLQLRIKNIDGKIYMSRDHRVYYNLQSSINHYPVNLVIDSLTTSPSTSNVKVLGMHDITVPSTILQLCSESIHDLSYHPYLIDFGVCTKFLCQHHSIRYFQQQYQVPLLNQIVGSSSSLVVMEISKLLAKKKRLGCVDCRCGTVSPLMDCLLMAATNDKEETVRTLLEYIENDCDKQDTDDLVRYRCYQKQQLNKTCSFNRLNLDTTSDVELLRHSEINTKILMKLIQSDINFQRSQSEKVIENLINITSRDSVSDILNVMRNSLQLFNLSIKIEDLYLLTPKEVSSSLRGLGIVDEKSCFTFVNLMLQKPIESCLSLTKKLLDLSIDFCNIGLTIERVFSSFDSTSCSGEELRAKYNIKILYNLLLSLQRLAENSGDRFFNFCGLLQSMGMILAPYRNFQSHDYSHESDNIIETILVRHITNEVAPEKFSKTLKNIDKNMDLYSSSSWLPMVCLPLVCLDELEVNSILRDSSDSGPNIYSLALSSLSSSYDQSSTQLSELMKELFVASLTADNKKNEAHDLIMDQLESSNLKLQTDYDDVDNFHTTMNGIIASNSKKVTAYCLSVAIRAASLSKYASRRVDLLQDFKSTILLAGISSSNSKIVQHLLTSSLYRGWIPDSTSSSTLLASAAASNNTEIVEYILSSYYGYNREMGRFIPNTEVVDINSCSVGGWTAIHSCLTGFDSLVLVNTSPSVLSVGNWTKCNTCSKQMIKKKRILTLLLDAGFHTNQLLQGLLCFPGYPTPIDLIASLNFWDVVSHILEKNSLNDFLSISPTSSSSSSSSEFLFLHSAMMGCNKDIIYWIEKKFLEIKKESNKLLYIQRMSQLSHLLMSRRSFEVSTAHASNRLGLATKESILHPSNDQSKFTVSLLHDAILTGNVQYITKVLKLTIEVVRTLPSSVLYGYADAGLLHYATYKNLPSVVSLLFESPFYIDRPHQRVASISLPFDDMKGYLWNPMQIASYKGHTDCCKLFMESFNSRDIDMKGENVLEMFKLSFFSRKDQCASAILNSLKYNNNNNNNNNNNVDVYTMINDHFIRFSLTERMTRTFKVFLEIGKSLTMSSSSLSTLEPPWILCDRIYLEKLVTDYYQFGYWNDTMVLLLEYMKRMEMLSLDNDKLYQNLINNANINIIDDDTTTNNNIGINDTNTIEDNNSTISILNDQSNHQTIQTVKKSIVIIKGGNKTGIFQKKKY